MSLNHYLVGDITTQVGNILKHCKAEWSYHTSLENILRKKVWKKVPVFSIYHDGYFEIIEYIVLDKANG